MNHTMAVSGRGAITQRSKTKQHQWVHWLSAVLLFSVLSVLCLMGKAFWDGKFDSMASLQTYIQSFGMLAPLALTLFQAFQVVVPVLPGFLGCAVGSVLFGPAVGFWCNYVGISLGSMTAFLLSRRFGMPLIQELFPVGRYDRWSLWASKSRSYTVFLFLAMLLPLFPDDFLCYLTGVSKMTARRFVWIIILGKPWCILAYSLGFSLLR